MKDNVAQWLAIGLGVALIIIYSVVMISTSGSANWAWLLLIAGIVVLVGGGAMLRRKADG